jgi:hypothetical protein
MARQLRFPLTATDGQVSGGGGVDKFRIKIWNINNGGVIVYDNVPATSDDINNANPQRSVEAASWSTSSSFAREGWRGQCSCPLRASLASILPEQ